MSSAFDVVRSLPGLRQPDWLKRVRARFSQHQNMIVMSVVFVGALMTGYQLLPGENERIAMLERDGHNQQALQILEQRFAQGDKSQQTLFQMQRLYEYFGNLPRAGQTLEMLAKQRPGDARVQRQLALFYRQTQNQEGYIAALQKQLAIRYSEPLCREIAGLHRRVGRFEDEQKTLLDCRAKGYRRPEDLIRLGYLLAADGALDQTAAMLRSVDDRRRLKIDRDRLMLFTALLETDQAVEAHRRALRWFKGASDDSLALILIDSLAGQSRYDLAIDLAREVGTPGDSVSLTVAELMLDREQVAAARAYLRGWLDASRLRDLDLTQRFISASLDAEDPGLAFLAAERFGIKRVPQSDLAALAEALSAIGDSAKFKIVRDALDPQLLSENPLLAAAVEAERGAAEPARQLLGRVQVDGLDEWRLTLWARLMETTGSGAQSSLVIRQLGLPSQATQSRVIRRLRETRIRRGARRFWRNRPGQVQPQVPGAGIPGISPNFPGTKSDNKGG